MPKSNVKKKPKKPNERAAWPSRLLLMSLRNADGSSKSLDELFTNQAERLYEALVAECGNADYADKVWDAGVREAREARAAKGLVAGVGSN